MDIKALKLELLERIAMIDNEVRLLALKRVLDAPRDYGLPNEHLSVVKEEEARYLKLEDRDYTAAEVRALVEQVTRAARTDQEDIVSQFTPAEWDAMDQEREQAQKGQGTFHTIEEVMEHLRKDLGK